MCPKYMGSGLINKMISGSDSVGFCCQSKKKILLPINMEGTTTLAADISTIQCLPVKRDRYSVIRSHLRQEAVLVGEHLLVRHATVQQRQLGCTPDGLHVPDERNTETSAKS